MKYLSICSGIEAATVAWEGLGWTPLAFSEIEAYPRAVLQNHYPDVPLHGDFTKLRDEPWIGDADVLVGGTPCQAFSIAGLRKSLDDDRGNLTLEFVRLANAIDDLRSSGTIIVWENVPGVLSVKDNAFGCFLAALVGDDAPLVPPRGKWSNAGLVAGPKRRAAWRILDAQFFGVPQRRRRVFVVASARDDFDPAEVLFEREGVQRHTAPRREAGKGASVDVAPSLVSSGRSVERVGETRGQDPVVAQCFDEQGFSATGAGYWRKGIGALRARTQDSHENVVAHSLRAQCFDRKRTDEYGIASVVSTVQARDYKSASDLVAHSLRAEGFDASEDGTGRGTPIVPVAFGISSDCFDRSGEGSGGTLGERSGLGISENVGQTLRAKRPNAVAYDMRGREGGAQFEGPHETANIRASSGGSSRSYVAQPMAVRRLTPRECERLQGFPDDYTLIPVRGKPAADGPRYKALGNSMAVPVMRWIGKRIQNS